MKPTLSPAARLVLLVMLVFCAAVVPSPARAKCKKDCKRVIGAEFRACKSACPKRKPGKSCRATCAADLKANRLACKQATNPTPPSCGQSTTTTTLGAGVTTTTVPGSGGTVVAGALVATPGHFTYNATAGLPGANAACSTNFSGSHACTLTELQGAPASDLTGLRDTGGNSVASFWAIDPNAPGLMQCIDDVGTNQNWEYGTAHTASRGQKVPLTNATGVLGSLQTGVQCNFSGNSWVACCH